MAFLILAFAAPGTIAYAFWSNTATATVSVSVAASAPTLSCDGKRGNDSFTVKWSAYAGAVSYTVYKAPTNDAAQYQPQVTTSAISYDVPHATNGTIYVRVKANTGPGSATGYSNTLQITRSTAGQGQGSSFQCTVVTP